MHGCMHTYIHTIKDKVKYGVWGCWSTERAFESDIILFIFKKKLKRKEKKGSHC